jgi:DNA-binding PucR family transcriptional regulator
MAGDFQVDLRQDVVLVTHIGRLEYADTNKAIAAAANAAKDTGTKLILIDLSRADATNYYSYTVRHAEFAPELGLDTTYKLAFVGSREAVDILEFVARVMTNHGWQARCFFTAQEGLDWLRSLAAKSSGQLP